MITKSIYLVHAILVDCVFIYVQKLLKVKLSLLRRIDIKYEII